MGYSTRMYIVTARSSAHAPTIRHPGIKPHNLLESLPQPISRQRRVTVRSPAPYISAPFSRSAGRRSGIRTQSESSEIACWLQHCGGQRTLPVGSNSSLLGPPTENGCPKFFLCSGQHVRRLITSSSRMLAGSPGKENLDGGDLGIATHPPWHAG
ncbi:hypothetical protein BDV59DRAFT_31454 [Aspergillus ambiguus]|uniref:uncharacterized protein n=1 Tax=Aspergillus ambiguus TaxID=176160 RepID=UPI003CCE0253